MKLTLQHFFLGIGYTLFSIIFESLVHGYIITIPLFLFLFLYLKLLFLPSLIIAICAGGITAIASNKRVFLESLVVFIQQIESGSEYGTKGEKFKKENERIVFSIPIKIEGKYYNVIEYSESQFDPRIKDKKDIKGFLIYPEENLSDDLRKKILGVYLFWRHIYHENILGNTVKLKTGVGLVLKQQLKFVDLFYKEIKRRKESNYSKQSSSLNENFLNILKELDDEVFSQTPFLKERLNIELSIFKSLYLLFTSPSDEIYLDLLNKINRISSISEEENNIWTKRLNTWEKLYKNYNLRINELPNFNFKKVGISFMIDLILWTAKRTKNIISEDTIKKIFKESYNVSKKKLLKFLNNYFVRYKFGMEAIKRNIEINKALKGVSSYYNKLINNIPLDKLRN